MIVSLLTLLHVVGCSTTVRQDLAQRRNASSWVNQVSNRPADLRVMSFNLRRPVVFDGFNNWGFRKNAALDMIHEVQPDLIGAQECVTAQARDLEKGLPGFAWVGVGRNDGKNSGEMTPIFFQTERFTLLDHGHFWFADKTDKPGKRAWGAWWPRMATWVHLQDNHNGETLFAFNAHLSAVSSNARKRSAVLLREKIGEIAQGAPVVVLGDFNTGTDSKPYETMTQDGWFADSFRVIHADQTKNQGTRHKFMGGTNGPRIDWVLATRQLRPTAAGIVNQRIAGRFVSDHFPVVTDLAWNTGRAPTLMAGAATRADQVLFNGP